jgi:hypothetical protein
MKNLARFLMVLLVLFMFGCSRDSSVAPPVAMDSDHVLSQGVDLEQAAVEIVAMSDWEIVEPTAVETSVDIDKSVLGWLLNWNREVLVDDIVHYSFQLRVGWGEFDVIGVHRVVRERRPHRPIHTAHAIFLQHGCCKDFVGVYVPSLYSDATPWDQNFAVHLARADIDVWGIDQSWTLPEFGTIPDDLMANWGLDRQLNDLNTAVSVARLARILTGGGRTRFILSGYSNGVPTTLALANYESQLPRGLRNVSGLVPVDAPVRFPEGEAYDTVEFFAAFYQQLYDSGDYNLPDCSFPQVAQLVDCCPDDPSPCAEGVTNLQYALLSYTGLVVPPSFHYWSPTLDGTGFPNGFLHTNWDVWFDFIASGTPYEPTIWQVEWIQYTLGQLDTPWDDYFADITVPVLMVTPGGGFGYDLVAPGLDLLGSTDVEILVPSLGGPPLLDLAHVDIFTAPTAIATFWDPLIAWIENR